MRLAYRIIDGRFKIEESEMDGYEIEEETISFLQRVCSLLFMFVFI